MTYFNPDKVWPGHPRLLPDELLSSWIVRLAKSNRLKLHTFTKLAFPGIEIWNRDIDKSAPIDLIKGLAVGTGRPITEVSSACLNTYEGFLYEKHIINTHLKWVLPLGIYHRNRRNHGIVYCPLCLSDDSKPYYRKQWRLALSIVCTKHGVMLKDSCSQCGSIVAFHRSDFNNRDRATSLGVHECSKCGDDLSRVKLTYSDESLLNFQRSLFDTIRFGFIKIDGKEIYSFRYFDVLHQLLKLITIDKHGRNLRRILECLLGIQKDCPPGRYTIIEKLPLDERTHALRLVQWLLEAWPENFIYIARKANLTKSRIERDLIDIPFWFHRITNDYFDFRTYAPTETEILNIIIYLKKCHLPVNNASISRILGVLESKVASRVLVYNKLS